MAKYRKKPVVIEAVLYTGDLTEVLPFIGPGVWEQDFDGNLTIPTLEGDHKARPGDWIIRGIKGELYPCKPDIFDATYEPAS